MTYSEKIACYLAGKYLRKKGYKPFAASLVAHSFAEELIHNPDHFSLKQRVWAWKRGFYAERIKMYGLSEENYKDYLSDADYMRLFPLNNRNCHWIDDKLTLRYVLSRYDAFLPAYYCSIRKNGECIPMMDWPESVPQKGFEAIPELLLQVGVIAAKPNAGSVGEGFYKLEYRDHQYWANGKQMKVEEFVNFTKTLRGYIFTEFVRQADLFENIYPGIAHTIRVQTARMPSGDIQCILSFLRIGSSKQIGCVTHSTSGVTASVNPDTGMITHPYYVDEQGNYIPTTIHPDTGKSVSFQIPRWDQVVGKCIEMHRYLGELDYLGFDVITTNESFKICEINSHSSIRSAQHGYPVWKNEKCAAFFGWKLGR